MKKAFKFFLVAIIFSSCNDIQDVKTYDTILENTTQTTTTQTPVFINKQGLVIKDRFIVPDGYERVSTIDGTFENYLQNLSLKPDGEKVKFFDGREKSRDVYLAVVDYSLGERDLQQCADAVMRLRAEYFYQKNEYDKISFHFVNGFEANFSKWIGGYGISVDGNNASWFKKETNNNSYESFQKYLDIVYAYASTLSLEKELVPKNLSDINIGDVFIRGGSPGHSVIVVDMAINKTNSEKLIMLAQSYMPAQDIQILKGDIQNSPWFYTNVSEKFITPEWTFDISELKTWQ